MILFKHHFNVPHRLVIAISIGVLSGLLCGNANAHINGTLVDLGWAFNAARDLVGQRDPYRHPVSPTLVPYPLTAAIVVLPWALFPSNIGLIILFGFATGLLAYGVLRDNQYWRLILFLSPSYFMAVKSMQWSPLFMAVLFFPTLAPILIAKPTLALPVACSIRWTWPRILGIVFIGVLSLLFVPSWPIRWLAQTGEYGGFVPLFTLVGPIFLVSLLFWRNAQARFFFLLTLTPQHYFFYDQLLVWMIPQTRRQMLVLTLASWIAFFSVTHTFPSLWSSGPYILGLMYLPALFIILWQQQVPQRYYRRFVLAAVKGQ